MPSKLQMLIDLALQQKGAYGAKRVQRAADEVKNLEKLYSEDALRQAFLSNQAALSTMKPGDFSKFAAPLPPGNREKYIKYLQSLEGFSDVPFLEVKKFPILEAGKVTKKPKIAGHEGRHRSLALEGKGEPASLVKIIPEESLIQSKPGMSQEELIEAMRRELGDRNVLPEYDVGLTERLPDIYKDGGAVGMAGGGRMLKNVAEMAAELASKKSKAIQPSAKPVAIDLEKIKSGGIEVPTSGFSKEQKSVLRPLYNQGLIRVEERDGKKMVVPGRGAWYEFSTPEQKAVLDSLQTSQGVKDLSLMDPTESLLNSAQASFFDFEIVPGVRNFSINKFEPFLPGYDSPNELKRIEELADKIRESKQIEPLFVGVDPTGETYIMEGQHRIRALKSLGYDEIPARVVIDMDDPNGMKKGGPVHMAGGGRGKVNIFKSVADMAAELAGKKKALPVDPVRAEREAALERARVNAVKILGLPENNTAMDRARAMGFNSDLFHGTTKDIKKFAKDHKVEKDYGWYGQGTYLTPDPDTASAYANWGDYFKNSDALEGQNVMPLMVRRGKVFDFGDAQPIKSREESEQFTENIRGLDFDTVEVPNKYADPKYSSNYETVVFDPSRIRSRFAAFDPAEIESDDLMKKEGGPVHMADAGSVDEAIRAATGKAPVGGRIIPSKESEFEREYRRKLAGISEPPPAEMREYNPTLQQRLGEAVKKGLQAIGSPESRARELSGIMTGGATGSPLPLGANLTWMNPLTAVTLGADAAARSAAQNIEEGNYLGAGLDVLGSALDVGPFVGPAYRSARKAIMPVVRQAGKAIDEAMQTGQGPLAGGLAAIMPRRIDVYHGSPHRFPPTERNPLGEFDPSKIGTGEGAQMYGYGHYVAEAPDVAKSYVPRSPIYEEKLLRKYNAARNAGNYPMMEVLEDAMLHRTPQEIVERFAGEEAGYTAAHQKAAADFSKWAAKNPPEVGGFYKVDLPDEHIARMLDWDKPLSEQPEAVRKAFSEIEVPNLVTVNGAERWASTTAQKRAHAFIAETGSVDDALNKAQSLLGELNPKTRDYSSVRQSILELKQLQKEGAQYGPVASKYMMGEDLYGALHSKLGPEAASEFFRQRGIPGIRYFDASSRGAGEGTRNFVIFPGGEELLTIKERMKKGGSVHKQYGGVLRRMAKYGKQFEPSKKTEIFIGEKSNLWNAGAAAKAESLEKAGVDPVDIWKQTGTFRSPDGKLRQEISDVGSKFRGKDEMKALAESMKAQENELKSRIAESKTHPDLFPKQLTEAQKAVRKDIKAIRDRRTMEGGPEYNVGYGNRAEFVLEHPELYEAYPILRGIDVQQGGVSGGTRAGYIGGTYENDPGLINIYQAGLSRDPRSSMTHEIQHAIQGIENWGRGGNPLTAFENPEAFKILENLRKAASTPTPFDEFAKNYEGLQPDEIKKKYDEYVSSIPKIAKKLDRDLQHAAADQYYNRLAGEAEARAVQERINMTPQERMETFPLSSYDVLPEDVIVKIKKKGGPVSQDAMNIAVMNKAVRKQVGGSARRIAMRSIEEATRLLQAAKNTRSKAAQIEAGLYHPIGGGVKMDKPIELMKAETKADKSIKMVPRRAATFEEMQGGIAIPLVGDRAAAGRILTGVGGLKLKRPVTLEGGGEYMLTHTVPDSDESSVWSSGKGVISGLQKQARIASEYGNPVYGINVVGSPTMVDFNTMLSEALLGQYDPTNLTKKARKEFLRELHNYAPDPSKPHLRPGKAILAADLDDPEMLREKLMAPGAGELRKAFANRMNLAPIQEAGFPNVAEARFAITDPRLVNAPLGTAGFTIGKINPEGIALERTVREHKSYPIGLAGEYFGSLDEPIDYREIFRDFYNKRRLMGKPEISDWRSFGMSPQFQPIDQELVDAIMSKGHKPREWKKGGKVTKKAVGGAMSAAQKAARAFVEARKAKGMPEYHQDWQKALQRGETPPAAPATKEQLDAEMQRLLETDKYKEMNRGGKVTNFGKKKKTITIDAMQMAVADKKLKGKKHG